MSPRSLSMVLVLLPLAASAQLSASDADLALDRHNDTRSMVAEGLVFDDGTDGTLPTATDMLKLVWDEDLATVAQDWADECTLNYNADRSADYGLLTGEANVYLGENHYTLVTSSTTRTDAYVLDNALDDWLAQSLSYHYQTFDSSQSQDAGSFIQVIWADTERVGCGVTQCTGADFGVPQFAAAYNVVCNYRRGGSFPGQYPYESGPTASNCPPELPDEENGLCTLPEPGALLGLACGGLLLLGLRRRR